MWRTVGIVLGTLGSLAFLRRRRRRSKRFDVGTVSEAWLASHRGAPDANE